MVKYIGLELARNSKPLAGARGEACNLVVF